MLLVSLPLMVGLAVLLTTSASTSLTASAQNKGQSIARALTLRVEDWVSERQESLTVLADAASGQLAADQTRSALGKIDRNYDDFSLIQLTDLNGKVLASSRSGGQHRCRRAGLVPDRRGWPAGGDLAATPGRSHPVDHRRARAGSQRPPGGRHHR